jgi:hypothetical protein
MLSKNAIACFSRSQLIAMNSCESIDIKVPEMIASGMELPPR